MSVICLLISAMIRHAAVTVEEREQMDPFITLKLALDKQEWFALREQARGEYREPAQQARWIIRKTLLVENISEINSSTEVSQAESAAVVEPK